MITPFSSPAGEIDQAAVARIIAHLSAARASIFLLGTTGESGSISRADRRRLVALVTNNVPEGTLVYAGISGSCFRESLEEADCWAQLGVAAAVAHVPGFYPLDDDLVLRYYEALADRVPLPLILYNIPATTHHSLSLDVVDKLSRHPRIIGLKDSEKNLDRLKTAIRLFGERSDFSFLVGWAAQSATALEQRADGLVPSTGNITPGLYQCMYQAALSGDFIKAAHLQCVTDRISALYQERRSLSRSLAALKALMSQLELCQPHVLPPLAPLPCEERALLEEGFRTLGIRDLAQPGAEPHPGRPSGYPGVA